MDNIYRVIAIDPGSTTLGYAILDIDMDKFHIELKDVYTININDALKSKKEFFEWKEYTKCRMRWLRTHLKELLEKDSPHCLIVEDNFMSMNVSSFRVLVQVKEYIEDALYNYDPSMQMDTVDPMTVKYGIGAVEKGKLKRKKGQDTKLLVRKHLENLDDLVWPESAPDILHLDEHSIDAVSIGYWKSKRILDYLLRDHVNFTALKSSLNNCK